MAVGVMLVTPATAWVMMTVMNAAMTAEMGALSMYSTYGNSSSLLSWLQRTIKGIDGSVFLEQQVDARSAGDAKRKLVVVHCAVYWNSMPVSPEPTAATIRVSAVSTVART